MDKATLKKKPVKLRVPKRVVSMKPVVVSGPTQTPVEKKKPERPTFIAPPDYKLPPGWTWVFNRLTVKYEHSWDNVPQEFEPLEYRMYPEDVANFLNAKSIIQLDTVANVGTRALVLEHDAGQYGVPYYGPIPIELIDRDKEANPVHRMAPGGQPTKVIEMPVAGQSYREKQGGGGKTSSDYYTPSE